MKANKIHYDIIGKKGNKFQFIAKKVDNEPTEGLKKFIEIQKKKMKVSRLYRF